jgi:polyisoprenyl-phosphate glycosyltransferase
MMAMAAGNKYLISVVVPAFNERQGIAPALQAIAQVLDETGVDWEIVVVDDGSRDGTFDEVCALAEAEPRIKGLVLSRNFGKESAMLAGMAHATGDAVIVIDADLQHPPQMIPQMLDEWRRGADIVHAVKRSRNRESLPKKSMVYVISKLISTLGGINIQNSSDFKLLDRQVVDVIVHQLPERLRFFRGLTSWIGFNEAYLFFDVEERQIGDSKWPFFALLKLSITALTSFTTLPLQLVTVLGVLTMILGVFVAGDALVSHFNGQAVSGFATTIICLLLIGSFIMISLGVIGEYIARIYEEIKARPAYLVKASVGLSRRAAKRRFDL